jgi:hypothetical protein
MLTAIGEKCEVYEVVSWQLVLKAVICEAIDESLICVVNIIQ